MKLPEVKFFPVALATGVVALACLLQSLRHWAPEGNAIDRQEWLTYDWRMRHAAKSGSAAVSTNLGFVFISDQTIKVIISGDLGYSFGPYWPRQVFGRAVRELKRQGANSVAFDVMFGEERNDHPPYEEEGKPPVASDLFFAQQLLAAGNAVLAVEANVIPTVKFRSTAWALGDISAGNDKDGVLRRVRAFQDYRLWHPVIEREGLRNDLQLANAVVLPNLVVLRDREDNALRIPVDADGHFEIEKFQASLDPDFKPGAFTRRARPFEDRRIWHMGIVMAAAELGLDLEKSKVDLAAGQIHLVGTNQVTRTIPVDANGFFQVDWGITYADPRLTKGPLESLLINEILRSLGQESEVREIWKGKNIVVGSVATGNDLTDRGHTPIEDNTYLVSKHWNVANSIITGRFLRRSNLVTELLIILAMGIAAAWLTLRFPPPWSSVAIAILIGGHVFLAHQLFVGQRLWIPIVLPVIGALLLNHLGLVTYQVVFEQREKRRVRGVFAKMVSPNVVNELLQAEHLDLGGSRRRITVFFADVRGFTEMTDTNQARAEKFVKDQGLTGAEAEAHFDKQAAETLATVNIYLATIADQIKKRNGTLDKYIGDCVMAFWGAPTPNERHAVDCVRAAIDAQLGMFALNLRRAAENQQREAENITRVAAGLPPLNMLELLVLGTGVNTGTAIVGLMGSDTHILSYTVFGREVNLASRLEGVSGRGRIIIGETTYLDIAKHDAELAAICVEQPSVTVKGIKQAVRIYEVQWRQLVPGGDPTAATGAPAAPAKLEAPAPTPVAPENKPSGTA